MPERKSVNFKPSGKQTPGSCFLNTDRYYSQIRFDPAEVQFIFTEHWYLFIHSLVIFLCLFQKLLQTP